MLTSSKGWFFLGGRWLIFYFMNSFAAVQFLFFVDANSLFLVRISKHA